MRISDWSSDVCSSDLDLTHPTAVDHDPARMLFLPMDFTTVDGDELSFFSTLATFGTALDITVAELSIEAFFPADAHTREALQRSEERRVGKECVRTCRSLWSP